MPSPPELGVAQLSHARRAVGPFTLPPNSAPFSKLRFLFLFLHLTVFLVSPSRKRVWDQLGNRRGKKKEMYQKVFLFL